MAVSLVSVGGEGPLGSRPHPVHLRIGQSQISESETTLDGTLRSPVSAAQWHATRCDFPPRIVARAGSHRALLPPEGRLCRGTVGESGGSAPRARSSGWSLLSCWPSSEQADVDEVLRPSEHPLVPEQLRAADHGNVDVVEIATDLSTPGR